MEKMNELATQIQTVAFLAYVMNKEGMEQKEALQYMAGLCAKARIALDPEYWDPHEEPDYFLAEVALT